MATNGITHALVLDKTGKAKSTVMPMSLDQYVTKAQRDVVVTPGINPAYVLWVNKMAKRLCK